MEHGRHPHRGVLPQGPRFLTLRIGIDGSELQGRPTGIGRYLRNLLRAWRAGADELVVYTRGPAPDDPVLAAPVRVRSLPAGRSPFVWQQGALAEAAAADALDVFFAPAYSCPLRLAVPRVTVVHDASFFAYPQDFGARHGLRLRTSVEASVRASAAVPVVSEFTRRELALLFPDAAPRITHVPHGGDDDLPPGPPREEARRVLGVRGPFVLTVGSIFNRRCLPELLQAARLLVRRFSDLRLDVVGDNRTSPPLDLDDLVARHGLERHVRLEGFVDERALVTRYAAADAAVFLSEYEGFGLPAMEAAARGVPLVVSARPSLGEIFGDAALTVDPRDPDAVAAALARVLSEPALHGDLAHRGRALARGHTWTLTAERTLAIVRAAAGRA